MSRTSGSERAKGHEWTGNFRYICYNFSGDHDKEKKELMAHIEEDKVYKVSLYTTPLFEDKPSIFYSSGLYHAYVVFYTETIRNEKFCWSLEKNAEGLFLQRSRNIEDVRDKIKGEERIKFPHHWQPELNINDESSLRLKELFEFIDETDQVSIKYTFNDENCKKFAKEVFDFIAKEKKWSYVRLFDF